jgi:hypothetical protein
MPLHYMNLDERTRQFMVEEIDMDVASGKIYLSNWLTEEGQRNWPGLLRTAAEHHDDGWMAAQLRTGGWVRDRAERRKPKGGFTMARVPQEAPDTMSEGEFCRYYVRGLCRRAVTDGVADVIVYRAKQVREPDRGSEEKVGTRWNPQAILDDLRSTQGLSPLLGIPRGPNSGLCIRLP